MSICIYHNIDLFIYAYIVYTWSITLRLNLETTHKYKSRNFSPEFLPTNTTNICFQPASQAVLHPVEPGWMEDWAVLRSSRRTHLLSPDARQQHVSTAQLHRPTRQMRQTLQEEGESDTFVLTHILIICHKKTADAM